jgi:hypothetical protein
LENEPAINLILFQQHGCASLQSIICEKGNYDWVNAADNSRSARMRRPLWVDAVEKVFLHRRSKFLLAVRAIFV